MVAKACNCLTREEKKLILANHEDGKSNSEIASIVRRSKGVVYRVINRFKADKALEQKPRTGIAPMSTKWKGRMSVKMYVKDRLSTATFISSAFLEKLFLIG